MVALSIDPTPVSPLTSALTLIVHDSRMLRKRTPPHEGQLSFHHKLSSSSLPSYLSSRLEEQDDDPSSFLGIGSSVRGSSQPSLHYHHHHDSAAISDSSSSTRNSSSSDITTSTSSSSSGGGGGGGALAGPKVAFTTTMKDVTTTPATTKKSRRRSKSKSKRRSSAGVGSDVESKVKKSNGTKNSSSGTKKRNSTTSNGSSKKRSSTASNKSSNFIKKSSSTGNLKLKKSSTATSSSMKKNKSTGNLKLDRKKKKKKSESATTTTTNNKKKRKSRKSQLKESHLQPHNDAPDHEQRQQQQQREDIDDRDERCHRQQLEEEEKENDNGGNRKTTTSSSPSSSPSRKKKGKGLQENRKGQHQPNLPLARQLQQIIIPQLKPVDGKRKDKKVEETSPEKGTGPTTTFRKVSSSDDVFVDIKKQVVQDETEIDETEVDETEEEETDFDDETDLEGFASISSSSGGALIRALSPSLSGSSPSSSGRVKAKLAFGPFLRISEEDLDVEDDEDEDDYDSSRTRRPRAFGGLDFTLHAGSWARRRKENQERRLRKKRKRKYEKKLAAAQQRGRAETKSNDNATSDIEASTDVEVETAATMHEGSSSVAAVAATSSSSAVPAASGEQVVPEPSKSKKKKRRRSRSRSSSKGRKSNRRNRRHRRRSNDYVEGNDDDNDDDEASVRSCPAKVSEKDVQEGRKSNSTKKDRQHDEPEREQQPSKKSKKSKKNKKKSKKEEKRRKSKSLPPRIRYGRIRRRRTSIVDLKIQLEVMDAQLTALEEKKATDLEEMRLSFEMEKEKFRIETQTRIDNEIQEQNNNSVGNADDCQEGLDEDIELKEKNQEVVLAYLRETNDELKLTRQELADDISKIKEQNDLLLEENESINKKIQDLKKFLDENEKKIEEENAVLEEVSCSCATVYKPIWKEALLETKCFASAELKQKNAYQSGVQRITDRIMKEGLSEKELKAAIGSSLIALERTLNHEPTGGIDEEEPLSDGRNRGRGALGALLRTSGAGLGGTRSAGATGDNSSIAKRRSLASNVALGSSPSRADLESLDSLYENDECDSFSSAPANGDDTSIKKDAGRSEQKRQEEHQQVAQAPRLDEQLQGNKKYPIVYAYNDSSVASGCSTLTSERTKSRRILGDSSHYTYFTIVSEEDYEDLEDDYYDEYEQPDEVVPVVATAADAAAASGVPEESKSGKGRGKSTPQQDSETIIFEEVVLSDEEEVIEEEVTVEGDEGSIELRQVASEASFDFVTVDGSSRHTPPADGSSSYLELSYVSGDCDEEVIEC